VSATERRRRPHPALTGAAMVCLLSVPGVLLSIFLTVVKFRSAYECDFRWFSACSGDFAECGQVLASDLSMLGSLPVSAFSTAVFLVMLGLAAATLRHPSKMAPDARPLLLGLASIALLVVVILGGYATFVIGGYCSYCVVIYAITGSLFLAVTLLHSQGLIAGYRALFSKQTLRSSALLLSLLSLMAVLSVQLLMYRRNAASISFGSQCILQDRGLPDTNIQRGPENPQVDIALFLDPSCSHCKRDFEHYYSAAESNPDIRLSIFHLPLADECLPAGHYQLRERKEASDHGACDASTAVECVERVAPGKGIDMLRELFKFQDESGGPWFVDPRRIDEAARRIGIKESLFDCIKRKPDRDLFHQHARFAFNNDITPPTTLFIFFDENNLPLPTIVRDQGKKERPLKATLAEAERVARGLPSESEIDEPAAKPAE